MQEYGYIERNLAAVRARIEAARAAANGAPVTLVAVTKSASDAEFLALMRLGVTDFGENRVQCYRARRELLAEAGITAAPHLIGTLQRNKVKYIADSVTLIQSLDSLSLAEEIEKQAAKACRVIPVLIEINSDREENKSGVLPEAAEELARAVASLPHLSLVGLMTMGRDRSDPEEYRPAFRETRALFEKFKAAGLFGTDAPVLSMGMSDSYEVAVSEGATMVRVGRTLFRRENEN